jgi:hypothetical protein
VSHGRNIPREFGKEVEMKLKPALGTITNDIFKTSKTLSQLSAISDYSPAK